MFIPVRMAMIIVNDAEKTVKFVLIASRDPMYVITFSPKVSAGVCAICIMNEKFGNHTAIRKMLNAIRTAIAMYAGLRNTSLTADHTSTKPLFVIFILTKTNVSSF